MTRRMVGLCLTLWIGWLPQNAWAVLDSCTVSASGVGFGVYNPFSGSSLDSTGTVTVSCFGVLGGVFQVALSTGGSGTFSPFPSGYLEEVYLDYGQTGGGTCVTISESGPTKTVLAVSNSPTDGAFYPRAIAVTTSNISAGSGGVVPIPLCNPLTVTVTGSNPATAAVTAYAKIRIV